MCPQAEQNVIEVLVIGQDEAAFHRGDMVREEAAETPHGADTAGLATGNHGTHRFTIVLNHGYVAITNEVVYRLEIIRIAKQVHRKYQPRAITDRVRERVEIEIQCVDIYVHKANLQPILAERGICRAPGHGGHKHFVTRPQRIMFTEEQGRDHEKIGRGTGIHHHGVAAAVPGGELLFEGRHFLSHREVAAVDDALHRSQFRFIPGRRRQWERFTHHWFALKYSYVLVRPSWRSVSAFQPHSAASSELASFCFIPVG